MTRRICLFAGYDRSCVVHEYVVLLARACSQVADVFYFCDNDLVQEERQKLSGLAEVIGYYRHERYDFGSWALMIDSLGWEKISKYDELILINDSCYGPINDLAPICEQMTRRECDFWGITASHEISFHVQSYFLVFKKPILNNEKFRKFWGNVSSVNGKLEYHSVVEKYEVGLSQLLCSEGFRPGTLVAAALHENLTLFPHALMKNFSAPLIKVKVFADPYIGTRERVSSIAGHLRQIAPDVYRAIASHQGEDFLTGAIKVQDSEPPFFFNFGPVKIRSIRGCRLKIVFWDKWWIIVPVPRLLLSGLSRMPFFGVRLKPHDD